MASARAPAGRGQLEDERPAAGRQPSSPDHRRRRRPRRHVDLMVCPPATLTGAVRRGWRAARRCAIGGQDCHAEPAGAFTGDISAEMLKDAGASAVIVGHSERRSLPRGDRRGVQAKALAAWRAGLSAIVCVGETRERARGRPDARRGRHASSPARCPTARAAENLVVAYEPVWAIGTGLTPTPADVAEVHGFIRAAARRALRRGAGEAMRILYGGSVKPSNAQELMHAGASTARWSAAPA